MNALPCFPMGYIYLVIIFAVLSETVLAFRFFPFIIIMVMIMIDDETSGFALLF